MTGTVPGGPRMTITTQLVLRAMLAAPGRETYGMEVCRETGLPSGTVHPILARLVGAGWAESRWEDADPKGEGRPRRRYYKLSRAGAGHARDALARAATRTAVLRLARDIPGGR
jgi:PadR family transcriptional regulator PadR